MDELCVKKLFSDLTKTIAKELLEGCEYPWEALAQIGDFIKKITQK